MPGAQGARRVASNPGWPVAQTVLILGASVRAAAQSAVRAGFAPWAADVFADADLCAVADARRVQDYPEGLATAAARAPLAPWMYTGALENRPELVQRIAAERPLWGNPADVLREVRDPWRVRRVLVGAGIACPRLAATAEGLPADGSWLCKPLRGSGGAGIFAWRGKWRSQSAGSVPPEAPVKAGARPVPAPGRVYFQERIRGKACSAAYVGAAGRAVLVGITRQLVGTRWAHARPFHYAGTLGPIPAAGPLVEQFQRIGRVLAEEFGLVGVFGVDAVVAGGRVWPVEVNPRWTASLEVLERAWAVPVFAWHAAACSGNALPERQAAGLRPPRCMGKAILFAPGEVNVTEAFARWARPMWAGRDRPELADVPAPGTRILPGRPVLTVFAEGASQAAVLRDLARRLAEVEARLTSPSPDWAARPEW